MVLKNILTRKNTKIYIFIILLMATLYAFITTLNNYYIKINNDNFTGSYIFIPTAQNNNLESDNFFEKIIYVEKSNLYDLYFSINNQVKDNTIYSHQKQLEKLNKTITNTNIKIKANENCLDNIIYLNNKTFSSLKLESTSGYFILLSDWSYIDTLLKKYNQENENIEVKYSEKYDENTLALTKIFKIFILIIKIIIIILYFAVLIDLLIDGKIKNQILYTLGATKPRIISLNIIEFAIFIIEFICCYNFILFILKFIF